MLTKSQQLMVEDGCPLCLFISDEDRKKAWEANPPKTMIHFGGRRTGENVQQYAAERAEREKLRAQNRIAKMKEKFRVGKPSKNARWDPNYSRWIEEGGEAVISITTNTRGNTVMSSVAQEPLSVDEELLASFKARNGTNREKLLKCLVANIGKPQSVPDLLKEVYGFVNEKNRGALLMVLKGVTLMIDKNKLPLVLVKEKDSYGLHKN